MHPVPVDASACVLPRRDWRSAAFALLAGGAGTGAIRQHKSSFLLAEADQGEGCHRKPEATGTEIGQVRRPYPGANLCKLTPAHTSWNHKLPTELTG
jgi:hypothetical protein